MISVYEIEYNNWTQPSSKFVPIGVVRMEECIYVSIISIFCWKISVDCATGFPMNRNQLQ